MKNTPGIMSTRVMICAAHQANMVLRSYIGEEKFKKVQ